MSDEEDNYTTVRIPKELAQEVEALIGKKGFRSKAEIVKEALRNLLDHYKEINARPLPRFERINLDENGVKILDREKHMVAEVHFKAKGIHCTLDGSDSCEHITFALSGSGNFIGDKSTC